jgi:hypothetical protein
VLSPKNFKNICDVVKEDKSLIVRVFVGFVKLKAEEEK